MHRLLWIGFQVLDETLSKTALFEISNHMAKRGNKVDFFGLRSKRKINTNNLHMRVIAVPLRTFPFLSHMFYVAFITLILPIQILLKRPSFVITEPKFGSVVFGFVLLFFPHKLKPMIIMDVRSTPVGVDGKNTRALIGEFGFNSSMLFSKRIFDGFTVVTEKMKTDIVNKFKITDKPVRVWTNGVNLELFNSDLYDRRATRKELGLNHKFVVFYHGSVSAGRGIVEAIKSIDMLRAGYPEIVFFILGSGLNLPLIEEQVRKLNLQNTVIIHKPVEYAEVPKYIWMSDLCLVPLPNIPDWRYQCPLKLIEYLSMGKPLVVTRIPANCEVLGDSNFAVSVSTANPDEFAKAITYAYKNIEHLKKVSAEGKLIIKERYDWAKIAQKLESFLDEFDEA